MKDRRARPSSFREAASATQWEMNRAIKGNIFSRKLQRREKAEDLLKVLAFLGLYI